MADSEDQILDLDQIRCRIVEQIQASVSTETRLIFSNELDQKESIRRRHQQQRVVRNTRELTAIGHKMPQLMRHFANGDEVEPGNIQPILEVVVSETENSDLFRLATMIWSIPVSKGFGRRMRYLVRDGHNNKLIGIFALGDPVFNLRTRDNWIGWNVGQRSERLAHVMDAYIVGAMPPYSHLLGGKLIASLIASDEVRDKFRKKYAGRKGIISELEKPADLALVTITSALGRSSVYNRLKLNDLLQLHTIGYTEGWGHFQIPDEVFEQLRKVLEHLNHPYANGHKYGHGPNWKIRTIREGLQALGLDPNVLRHGIRREVFALALCQDVQAFLRGEIEYQPIVAPATMITEAAKKRWILPRAERLPEYREWTREQTRCHFLASTIRQLELS